MQILKRIRRYLTEIFGLSPRMLIDEEVFYPIGKSAHGDPCARAFASMGEPQTAFADTMDRIDAGKPDTASPANRKIHNCTKMTQYEFDFIRVMHNRHLAKNVGWPRMKRQTIEELIVEINNISGINKSRTAISKVWQGGVNREDLVAGVPYFSYA